MIASLLSASVGVLIWAGTTTQPAGPARQYFAHRAVEDRHGVIAPWYQGLNGQCDLRVRVAAETMKRYPWKLNPQAGRPVPEYVFNGRWSIDPDGTIHPGELTDWGNGDLTQRGAYAMLGWIDYYRYSGDPAAIAHIYYIAETILGNCQTDERHPWPRFLIGVPNRGTPFGLCDPRGMNQLDLVCLFGLALTQGYELTGEDRWLEAVKHWGDVLAEKRNRTPGEPPWNRYANPEDVPWNDLQTGGVYLVVRFLDELIRVGHTGRDNEIVKARDDGLAYLHILLERWIENDTWARDYWDWYHDVQGEDYSEMVPRYLLRHPELFPNWRADARNIMSLYLQRSCVAVKSAGGVYSGAWAYPEGARCCGTSLSYAPMQVGAAFAEYGVTADDEWAREMARRQFILATYDAYETGVVLDGIDGKDVVAGGWFQIAHPFVLRYVLEGIAWLPEVLGANRENHIVRSSSVVRRVFYGDGRIAYQTFDAPANTVDVLRLAFRPSRITADGLELRAARVTEGNGYEVRPLPNGDCIVVVRHDGLTDVVIEGEDPQRFIGVEDLEFKGSWGAAKDVTETGRVSSEAGAEMICRFEGNQVRLIGTAWPAGGQADVFLDGVQQLCGIDAYCPYSAPRHVLFYRNGLSPGRHTLRVVARGTRNAFAGGGTGSLAIDGVQYSAASGEAGFGSGGGPTGAQRWVLGYPERVDYVDSAGRAWRPGTEVLVRLGKEADDSVAQTWYTAPRRQFVANTQDPVLYRHGMHHSDMTAYVTVGPGTYHVRLKLMEHRAVDPTMRAMDVWINGRPVVERLDIAATASGRPSTLLVDIPGEVIIYEGLNTAVDLVFNDIQPEHGVIAVRLAGCNGAEAILSALEVGPGPGGEGAKPITVPTSPPTK